MVEVISPSTRLTDTVTKRAVYERWGIPAYLVVDPGDRTGTCYGDRSTVEWAVQALATGLPPSWPRESICCRIVLGERITPRAAWSGCGRRRARSR